MKIELEVLGRPAPKGSGRAILVKGRAMHVPSGSNVNRDQLRSWDANVRAAAQSALGWGVESPPFVETPLSVHIVFRLARPASHWGKNGLKPKAPKYPITKPDKDKLTRATCDSLKGIIYDDDSRICRSLVEKTYATPGTEGATITIEELV